MALLLALPGCLVSFNDYPLGDLSAAGAAGGGNAGLSFGGGGGGLPKLGNAGSSAGGVDQGAAGESGASVVQMVDDFEDGNDAILEQQGRKGRWYVVNDGKGQQTPNAGAPLIPSAIEPARSGSKLGAHTYGGPFQTWGALIGFAFASSGNTPLPYDLSGFAGLRLWVRTADASSESVATQVRLSLTTPGTSGGGGCNPCNDHFGADIPLTSKWEQIDIPFTSLKQNGFGRPQLPSPDLAHVTGLLLSFLTNQTFDLWLDDIELY